MFGDRFSSSTSCSKWRRETKPGRLDQSRSCYFLKVATHPLQQPREQRHQALSRPPFLFLHPNVVAGHGAGHL